MNVKINTKEKFHEVCPQDVHLAVNMTDELTNLLTELQNVFPHNLVLNMENLEMLDNEIIQLVAQIQHQFYENSHSFVICQLQPSLEKQLDEAEWLEMLNVTPTLSEAWDIVQMEEIERELLDGFEE